MCDVTAGLKGYQDVEAEVIGISVDSPFAQEAWAQKEKIGFTLASDLNKDVTKAYDVLLADLVGIGSAAKRAAFVIDRNGVIQYSEATPTPKELPNFEAVRSKLGELR
jgi:peroxiredoxin